MNHSEITKRMFNKAMIDFENQGVKDAREIYVEMQRQVAKYQKA